MTDRDLAEEWFLERVDASDLEDNPVLAKAFEDQVEGADYERARQQNRPSRADRAFIDAKLEEAFDTDDEDDEEMLDRSMCAPPKRSK